MFNVRGLLVAMLFVVAGGCWLVYDFELGRNSAQFHFDTKWQDEPATLVRFNRIYEHVESHSTEAKLQDSFVELAEMFRGVPVSINVSDSVGQSLPTDSKWNSIQLAHFTLGSDIAKLDVSAQLRSHAWQLSSVIGASVSVVCSGDLIVNPQQKNMLVFLELSDLTRLPHISEVLSNLGGREGKLLDLRHAVTIRGKRHFNPNLVANIGFETEDSIVQWAKSVATLSRLALLDQDLNKIEFFPLRLN